MKIDRSRCCHWPGAGDALKAGRIKRIFVKQKGKVGSRTILHELRYAGERLVTRHEMKRPIQRQGIRYSHCRLHCALGYQTPVALERALCAKAA